MNFLELMRTLPATVEMPELRSEDMEAKEFNDAASLSDLA